MPFLQGCPWTKKRSLMFIKKREKSSISSCSAGLGNHSSREASQRKFCGKRWRNWAYERKCPEGGKGKNYRDGPGNHQTSQRTGIPVASDRRDQKRGRLGNLRSIPGGEYLPQYF